MYEAFKNVVECLFVVEFSKYLPGEKEAGNADEEDQQAQLLCPGLPAHRVEQSGGSGYFEGGSGFFYSYLRLQCNLVHTV